MRWIKRLFIVLLLLVMVAALAGGGFLFVQNQKVYKAKTPLSKEGEKELQAVSLSPENYEIPERAKIIGLGEYSHGNSRTQSIRKTLAQRLYALGDLKALVLEMPYVDGLRVNAFIHGKDESIEKIMQEFQFFLYQTEEMKELFLWLREINDAGGDINFYGMDMQDWERPKEEMNKTLDALGIDERIEEKDPEQLQEIEKLLATKDLGEEETDILLNLRVLKQRLDFEKTLSKENYQAYSEASAAFRDRAMGENTLWIQKREGGRVLLMGHNGHIGKTSTVSETAGGYLAEQLKDGYLAIGTQAGRTFLVAVNTGIGLNSGEDRDVKTFILKNKSDFAKALGKAGEELILPLDHLPKDLEIFMNQDHALLLVGATMGTVQKIVARGHYDILNPTKTFDALWYFPEDTTYTFIEEAYFENK